MLLFATKGVNSSRTALNKCRWVVWIWGITGLGTIVEMGNTTGHVIPQDQDLLCPHVANVLQFAIQRLDERSSNLGLCPCCLSKASVVQVVGTSKAIVS